MPQPKTKPKAKPFDRVYAERLLATRGERPIVEIATELRVPPGKLYSIQQQMKERALKEKAAAAQTKPWTAPGSVAAGASMPAPVVTPRSRFERLEAAGEAAAKVARPPVPSTSELLTADALRTENGRLRTEANEMRLRLQRIAGGELERTNATLKRNNATLRRLLNASLDQLGFEVHETTRQAAE